MSEPRTLEELLAMTGAIIRVDRHTPTGWPRLSPDISDALIEVARKAAKLYTHSNPGCGCDGCELADALSALKARLQR